MLNVRNGLMTCHTAQQYPTAMNDADDECHTSRALDSSQSKKSIMPARAHARDRSSQANKCIWLLEVVPFQNFIYFNTFSCQCFFLFYFIF